MAGSISINFSGVIAFQKAINPERFKKLLVKHVGSATGRNLLVVEKASREVIKKGGLAANAALTVALKRSSKPLVHKGQLWQSITSKQKDWASGFVGILYTDPLFNLAKNVHDGVTIKVTPKMRAMFYLLWEVSIGRKSEKVLTGRALELWKMMPRKNFWKPLKAGTKVIRIPPRPFFTKTFNDYATRKKVLDNWEAAVQRALEEASRP